MISGLRPFCPDLEKSDLNFFGKNTDVSLPIKCKYCLDITCEIVYNIKSSIYFEGTLLISDARENRGFLNICISDNVILSLIQSLTDQAVRFPAERIEIGYKAAYIHARLLDAAFQSRQDAGIPHDDPARRALLQCLLADSPESLNIALRTAEKALRHDRQIRAEGKESSIGKTAALAMAASLEKFLY